MNKKTNKSMEFDKQRLLNNIKFLIKMNDIKISKVESDIGISQGYLSRLSKNDTMPKIDLIYNLAKYLGVSIDVLINNDFSEVTDGTECFIRFLNKLEEGIETDNVESRIVSYDELHKVFKYQDRDEKRIYSSFLPKNKVWLANDVYCLTISSNIEMYILKVIGEFPHFTQQPNGKGFTKSLCRAQFYEIYFRRRKINKNTTDKSEWELKPICNTLKNHVNLKEDMNHLYNMIAKKEKDLKINPSVHESIDKFM